MERLQPDMVSLNGRLPAVVRIMACCEQVGLCYEDANFKPQHSWQLLSAFACRYIRIEDSWDGLHNISITGMGAYTLSYVPAATVGDAANIVLDRLSPGIDASLYWMEQSYPGLAQSTPHGCLVCMFPGFCFVMFSDYTCRFV